MIKKRYLKIAGLVISIILIVGIYYLSKIIGFYPNEVKNSNFKRISIGQTKAEVLKILEGIPSKPTLEGFPGAFTKIKCMQPYTGLSFDGAPGTTNLKFEDHFVVFFDQNNLVCDTMRYGL